MTELLYTTSLHCDFQRLASELEKEIYERDGDMADQNYLLNAVGEMKNALVLYEDEVAVACGAFRVLSEDTVELKRMYVVSAHRRKNFASLILTTLECAAKEKGFQYVVLETGLNQPEAIAFYAKHGFRQVEKFGRYTASGNSVCFKKTL